MDCSENLERKDSIEPIIKIGTWAIGFIDLAEILKFLIGKLHGESDKSQKLGLKIVKAIRNNSDKFKEKHHFCFSCYPITTEGLSDKFSFFDEK